MNWSFFGCVTAAISIIAWFEWPRLKQKPARDRAAFISLLLLGWILSMFDLPHIPGPTNYLQHIYKPLSGWLKH
ncbi:hypothetical protein ACHHV8_13795 [Paenibacillus sp. TAB 01]|uniref:hypothetical protein n=1 Tax=Paenibacillus sp. TAB 01 TaxID=3368988 RepID=UPI003752949C